MVGLTLYTSNKLELLVDQLAETVIQPLDSALDTEKIIVQSLGMRRWLSLELASRHGICANVDFPFPQTFVSDVFHVLFPDLTKTNDNSYERAVMIWRIMKVLPSLLETKEFVTLHNYLSGECSSMKHYQLASRIAHTFDQYLVFRPEMILHWDEGKETHWQALLWRELAQGSSSKHQPALLRKLGTDMREKIALRSLLPKRVSIFGISSLPKFYLDLVNELSGYLEVHFFLKEPTPEWWSDIVSAREEVKFLRKQKAAELTASSFHLERGNSLLASMGKLGK